MTFDTHIPEAFVHAPGVVSGLVWPRTRWDGRASDSTASTNQLQSDTQAFISPTILAYVVGTDGNAITTGSISSIGWELIDRDTDEVVQDNRLLTVSTAVQDVLQTGLLDPRWDLPGGFNFIHELPAELFKFAEKKWRYEATLLEISGHPIRVVAELDIKPGGPTFMTLQELIDDGWGTSRVVIPKGTYTDHTTAIVIPDTNPLSVELDGHGVTVEDYGFDNTAFTATTNGQKWHIHGFHLSSITDGVSFARVGFNLKNLGRMLFVQNEMNACDIGIQADLVLGSTFHLNEYQNCYTYGMLLKGQGNICQILQDRHFARSGQTACLKIEGPVDRIHAQSTTFEGSAPVTTIHIDQNASPLMGKVTLENIWCEHEPTGQTIWVESPAQIFTLEINGWRELRASQTTPWLKVTDNASDSANFRVIVRGLSIQSGAGSTAYFDTTISTDTGKPSGTYTSRGIEYFDYEQLSTESSRYDITSPDRWVSGVMPRNLTCTRQPQDSGWQANKVVFREGLEAYTEPAGYPWGTFAPVSTNTIDTNLTTSAGMLHLWNMDEASGTRSDYLSTLNLAVAGGTVGSTTGLNHTAADFSGGELSAGGTIAVGSGSIAFDAANNKAFYWTMQLKPHTPGTGTQYILRLANATSGSGETNCRYWLRIDSTGKLQWAIANDAGSSMQLVEWPTALVANEQIYVHVFGDLRRQMIGMRVYGASHINNTSNGYELSRPSNFDEYGGPTSGLTLYVGGEGDTSDRYDGAMEQLIIGTGALDKGAEHFLLGGNMGSLGAGEASPLSTLGQGIDLTSA